MLQFLYYIEFDPMLTAPRQSTSTIITILTLNFKLLCYHLTPVGKVALIIAE